MTTGPVPLPDLATVLGLVFGLLARIGYALDQGTGLNRRQIVGHVLMLGVCYAVAQAGGELGSLVLTPNLVGPTARMLSAAGIALAAAKVVPRLRASTAARIEARFPIPADPEQPK